MPATSSRLTTLAVGGRANTSRGNGALSMREPSVRQPIDTYTIRRSPCLRSAAITAAARRPMRARKISGRSSRGRMCWCTRAKRYGTVAIAGSGPDEAVRRDGRPRYRLDDEARGCLPERLRHEYRGRHSARPLPRRDLKSRPFCSPNRVYDFDIEWRAPRTYFRRVTGFVSISRAAILPNSIEPKHRGSSRLFRPHSDGESGGASGRCPGIAHLLPVVPLP